MEGVKRKLNAILKAFGEYIGSQDYFDIVYSKKTGYLYFVVATPDEAGPELIHMPEELLDLPFNEMINNVINSPENKTHIPESRTLTEWDEAESRRRITPYPGTGRGRRSRVPGISGRVYPGLSGTLCRGR